MPTRDYDPINEIIEAVGATRIWPITKVTTDAKGNITIGPGSINDYVNGKTSSISTRNPEPAHVTTKEPVDPFAIRSVLSNRRKNAFSVVWEDGTTTVIHCQSGDEWDDEKALAMCFTKKALGNKGNFNDKFNDALDNKMKIIPGSAGIIAEKECDCDSTCRVCECKMTVASVGENRNGSYLTEEAIANASTEETIKRVEQSAEKTEKTFENMVKELAGSVETKKEESYELYLVGTFTNTKNLVHRGTLSELRDFIRHYARKGSFGYYFRTWNADGGMYLDYGSYSQYFFIPGMTNSEYSKN